MQIGWKKLGNIWCVDYTLQCRVKVACVAYVS